VIVLSEWECGREVTWGGAGLKQDLGRKSLSGMGERSGGMEIQGLGGAGCKEE
jgi:hypothetical protein